LRKAVLGAIFLTHLILDSFVDRGVCFLDSARPQAVDQYPGLVVGGGALVRSLEFDIICGNSLDLR